MDNYRPMWLLTPISKVFVNVVSNQLFTHFILNASFQKGQYLFRGHYSTDLANIEPIDKMTVAINDEKNLLISVLMCLSKC